MRALGFGGFGVWRFWGLGGFVGLGVLGVWRFRGRHSQPVDEKVQPCFVLQGFALEKPLCCVETQSGYGFGLWLTRA